MKKEKLAPEQEILLYEREYMTEDELSDSFAEFIRKKRKEVLSPNGKEGISIQEHADLLGLSKGMYQKILNKQKETQFRDCIIAICVSLSLDVEDTNTALKLYAYMPGLDENCPRDQKIIEVLDGEVDNLISIEAVNERLTRYGFEPLRIIKTITRESVPEYTMDEFIFSMKPIITASRNSMNTICSSISMVCTDLRYLTEACSCKSTSQRANTKNTTGFRARKKAGTMIPSKK